MKTYDGQENKIRIPSIKVDIFKSIFITVLIVGFLSTIFLFFGDAKIFDSRITALFGAILAFSGLMSKQYLLKENISYLNKWKCLEKIIDDITTNYSSKHFAIKQISDDLSRRNNQAFLYTNYIVNEIKCMPIIPFVLVVLYGAALTASGNLLVSVTCLVLMLTLVAYLALATITSNNLFIDTSDLDETIKELEGLIELLESENELNKNVH